MKKYISCFISLCIIVSCKSNITQIENRGQIDIKVSKIDIHPIEFKINNSSYMGFSGIGKDSLYFFDEFFNHYYHISLDGKIGKKQGGLGRGPGELPVKNPLEARYCVSNNSLIALGGTNDIFIMNQMTNAKRIGYKMDEADVVSYDSATSYTLWPEIVADCDGKYFYYNVQGNDDAVGIMHSDYYEKAALLMRVDINSGEVEPIGHYSTYYAENRDKLKHLPFYYFDVAENGDIYVTHQADPLIYRYDSDFNLKRAFGFDGIDMNTEYSNPGSTQEQFMEAYEKDMQGAGFYYWVHHINGYTFRSYKKQGVESQDGLQIYKGETLIGDVEVPANFKVIGYIKPYFVTKIICDEENEVLKFYKFKL